MAASPEGQTRSGSIPDSGWEPSVTGSSPGPGRVMLETAGEECVIRVCMFKLSM